ncbi:MAG: bleomycin resistance protein [Leptolyngbyaceae cyanobacterium SM2_5_2]|nr:bleomycin resistance protein [Leptolyngbyaceae cyanobacterium SM2_5_2]
MKVHRFEHINLSCKSLDASQFFYQTLFPDWRVRAQGLGPGGSRWVHFGNDQVYLALNDDPTGERHQNPYEGIGINHIGFVIEDGEALKELLAAKEIEYYTMSAPETRHRIYVSDPDGNEIEFVEYQSDYPLR